MKLPGGRSIDARALGKGAGLVALGALLWISLLKFPTDVAGNELDPSWRQANAHILKNNLQAGVDIIFTYGPLGYFASPVYDADLFGAAIVWQVIFTAACGFFIVSAFLHAGGPVERAVFVVALLLLTPYLDDAAYFALLIMAVTMWGLRRTEKQIKWIPLGYLVLVALSLFKFTYLVQSIGCVAVLGMAAGIRRSYRHGLFVGGTFVLMFAIGWLFCGQSLLNLPRYFLNAIELTRGYNETVAVEGPAGEVALGIVTMLFFVGFAAFATLSRPWHLSRFFSSLILLGAVFVQWKNGFVRHDSHPLIYFGFMAVIPFLVMRPPELKLIPKVVFYVLLGLGVLTPVIGFTKVGERSGAVPPRRIFANWNERRAENWDHLTHPGKLRETNEAKVASLKRQWDLASVREEVGDATIDVISFEQGVAFLNDLNWHPRPLMHSYLAFTPKLLRANADFYSGSLAPEYVLFRLRPIDRRFPPIMDSEVLKVLYRDYLPVLGELDFLLLRRREESRSLEKPTFLMEREVAWGEWIDVGELEGNVHYLSLDIRPSLLGRLRTFFFRASLVHLELAGPGDFQARYRIVPDLVRSSVILKPLILSTTDFMNVYVGEDMKAADFIRVAVDPEDSRYWKPTVGVRLEQAAALSPARRRDSREESEGDGEVLIEE